MSEEFDGRRTEHATSAEHEIADLRQRLEAAERERDEFRQAFSSEIEVAKETAATIASLVAAGNAMADDQEHTDWSLVDAWRKAVKDAKIEGGDKQIAVYLRRNLDAGIRQGSKVLA